MIYFFSGKPGNGKSLHMAEIMYYALRSGKNVIANFQIDEFSLYSEKRAYNYGWFVYEPNKYWLNNAYKNRTDNFSYLDGLYNFALFHV